MSEATVLVALGAIALAALVALTVRELFLGYPPPLLPPGATLTPKEQAFLAAAADAFFPRGGPIPLSGTEAGLVAYMDAYLARVSAASRALLGLLFVFGEHGPWVFGPRRARFTRLSHDERIAALGAMATSGIYFRRVAFLSLRTMLSMGYLANAAVARRIGMTAHASPFEASAGLGADSRPSLPPPAPGVA